jgi:methionyl-tRNA formyltransferase
MTNRIVFMGTPEFAVPSLEGLAASGHSVQLVVTQPDRPKGRGRRMEPPPVKRFAEGLGLRVIQPESMRDETVLRALAAAEADFFVVVAFGHILRENLLKLPRLACINVHASLLPAYRGPAPIQWAVINGERETGVTTMIMEKGLDTGDILMTAREPIGPDDTAGTLHDRLARSGAALLGRTLQAFADGTIRRTPQDHAHATYAPLLKKEDGRIDWKRPASALEPFVRGMTPWPGAYAFWEGMRLKIFRVGMSGHPSTAAPGTVLVSSADELVVATGEGALSLREVQIASGTRLPISDFLRGCRIPPGDVFA